MSDNIIHMHGAKPTIAGGLLDMIQDLLERVRDGSVIGVALVEHRRDDAVAHQVFAPDSYHQINSGAARLAHYLAGIENT